MDNTRLVWAAEWFSKNKMDGERRHLLRSSDGLPTVTRFGLPSTFATKREAKAWIDEHYGYIRDRPDLKAEPHGWRVPRAVRVEITITKLTGGYDGQQIA